MSDNINDCRDYREELMAANAEEQPWRDALEQKKREVRELRHQLESEREQAKMIALARQEHMEQLQNDLFIGVGIDRSQIPDFVALRLGPETHYLKPNEARMLGNNLLQTARDVEEFLRRG